MTDLAWNSAGEEIPNPNLNGLPAQIRDVQEYDIVAIESTGGVPVSSDFELLTESHSLTNHTVLE